MKLRSLALLLLFCFVMGNLVLAQKKHLQFKGETFKIVQFTDIHWIEDETFRKGDDSAIALMRTLIAREQPDLVVFTGDNVVSGNAVTAWKKLTDPFIEYKLPFLVTFGNHDTEADISKAKALETIQQNPYNLTYNADPLLPGMGNCAIAIKDGKFKDSWVLYLLDSHAYNADTIVKGYDWIKQDQIQWYRTQRTAFTKANGRPVPSLAFFHIPLPEFEQVAAITSFKGNALEQVCAPYVNSGMFAAFAESSDMVGVFVGHDHNNDFVGVHQNICLGYGRKTGYNAPYKEVLPRGARVIVLHRNKRELNTYVRDLNGRQDDFKFKKH